MKEHCIFAIGVQVILAVEIVLAELEIHKNTVGELPEHLDTGTPQANVDGVVFRLALYRSSRVAFIITKPCLVQKSNLKKVRSILIQLVFDGGISVFFFGGVSYQSSGSQQW